MPPDGFGLLMRAEKALAAEISDADQRDNAGSEEKNIGDEAVDGAEGHGATSSSTAHGWQYP